MGDTTTSPTQQPNLSSGQIHPPTSYYGVIGDRDYIKYRGDRHPFWEFLDHDPDGWLTSLRYRRDQLPLGLPMIYDCGAWSYRKERVPPIDARQAAAAYREHAPEGCIVVAPDHMLIDGADIEFRRQWNEKQAKRFVRVCPDNMVPMACIHGMDIEERMDHAKQLREMGYKHIAVGGLAARAGQKERVTMWVRAIRDSVPDCSLHVLGLSSPAYMKSWREIGVQSADGSSHFKQAFTGGLFYTQDGAHLVKHQAARPGNAEDPGIVAPLCECKACTMLRDDGVDTRSFGSNEHNMGRAAHNMNILMRAQQEAMRREIVLVACCGQKLKGRHRAADIYQSDLFRKSRRFAENSGNPWLILSAKHGVLRPDARISDYDLTLNTMDAASRARWNATVSHALAPMKADRFVVLAGSRYCGWTSGFDVVRPMQGLGIGQQLAWLKARLAEPSCDWELWPGLPLGSATS